MSETPAPKKKRNRKPKQTKYDDLITAVTSMSLEEVKRFHDDTGKYLDAEVAKLKAQLALLEGVV